MNKFFSFFNSDSDTAGYDKGVSISDFPLSPVLKAIPCYAIHTLLIFTPLARGSVQGWAVCVIHIITLIALSAFLLEKSITQEWMRIKTLLDKPIFALSVLVLLSTVFSVHILTSIEAVILFADYIIIFYLVIQTIHTRSQFRQLIYIIMCISAFVSIIGFLKNFGINPFSCWDYKDSVHGINSSVFGNANHLAGYMEMVIPLIIGISMSGYKEGKLLLTIFLTIIMLISLILSLSRGGLFSLFMGLSFMATCLLINRHFKHKKYLILLTGILPILLLFTLSNDQLVNRLQIVTEQKEESVHSRLTAWNGVVKMIYDYPLFGTVPEPLHLFLLNISLRD